MIPAIKRNNSKVCLEKKGILTVIYYPYSIFEQKTFKSKFRSVTSNEFPVSRNLSKKILALTINQFLARIEIKRICKEISKFYKN